MIQILSNARDWPPQHHEAGLTFCGSLEIGCRFESRADQLKLDYYLKIQEMPACRLPKLVWQHKAGGRVGGRLGC
jgi:hypothetical protein